jgi:hypothetical protein
MPAFTELKPAVCLAKSVVAENPVGPGGAMPFPSPKRSAAIAMSNGASGSYLALMFALTLVLTQ